MWRLARLSAMLNEPRPTGTIRTSNESQKIESEHDKSESISEQNVLRRASFLVVWASSDKAARAEAGSVQEIKRLELRTRDRDCQSTQSKAGIRLCNGPRVLVNLPYVNSIYAAVSSDCRLRQVGCRLRGSRNHREEIIRP